MSRRELSNPLLALLGGSVHDRARKAGVPEGWGFKREMDWRTGRETFRPTGPLRSERRTDASRGTSARAPQRTDAERAARHAALKRTMGSGKRRGTREERFEAWKLELGHPSGVFVPVERLRLLER